MDNFDDNKILNEPNKLINEIVNWIKKRNKEETYPIEAVTITLSFTGSYYRTSYMCFDWEKRNPEEKDKSIWDWWSDSKIIAKFKFKDKAESMDSKRVFKRVQKTIFDLQKKIKERKVKQKLRGIENVFA